MELHQKLQSEFGDPGKHSLMSNLDQLRKEFTINSTKDNIFSIKRKKNIRILLSIAAAFMIFSFLAWLFIFRTPDKDVIVEETPPTEEEIIPTPNTVDPQNNIHLANDDPNDKKDNTPVPPKKPMSNQNNLADLKPNAAFENLILKNQDQKILNFEIDPSVDAPVFTATGQKVDFELNGTLFTPYPEESNRFKVQIFSNKSNPNASAQTAFSLPLEKAKIDEDEEAIAYAGKDQYNFNLKEEISLPPGLYYYTIVVEGETKVVRTGKFLVKEQ